MEEPHKRIRCIRSALIALTSAVHSHQDQTLYRVRHKFEDGSDEHLAVKKLVNDIYSDCFAYRWLIELRHVMLHVNMDAFTVSMTARLHGDATIELGMSRYWMSKSSGVMKKAYKRTELEAMTEDPSVLDMIKDLQPAFGWLQDKIDAIMYPSAEVVRKRCNSSRPDQAIHRTARTLRTSDRVRLHQTLPHAVVLPAGSKSPDLCRSAWGE